MDDIMDTTRRMSEACIGSEKQLIGADCIVGLDTKIFTSMCVHLENYGYITRSDMEEEVAYHLGEITDVVMKALPKFLTSYMNEIERHLEFDVDEFEKELSEFLKL